MYASKYPVIVRLQGGLGNQLFQYAVGRAIALKYGHQLMLDSRRINQSEIERHYDLYPFQIEGNYLNGHARWCTRWATSERLGSTFRILWPFAWHYKIIIDKESGYDPSIFEQHKGPLILQGYWQSFRYFEAFEKIIRDELRFKYPPDSENLRVIQSMDSLESVAIHIRRGDYVTNPFFNQTLGTCTLEYYHSAARYLARHLLKPFFYIFTDAPQWAKDNLSLPGPARILDHNFGKADYEDLRLMTHCKHFVIANSSFSWWGAWLASHKEKIVIAPKRWFTRDKSPVGDRIPLGWVRL